MRKIQDTKFKSERESHRLETFLSLKLCLTTFEMYMKIYRFMTCYVIPMRKQANKHVCCYTAGCIQLVSNVGGTTSINCTRPFYLGDKCSFLFQKYGL